MQCGPCDADLSELKPTYGRKHPGNITGLTRNLILQDIYGLSTLMMGFSVYLYSSAWLPERTNIRRPGSRR
jgi:hypothetical protein